MQTFSGDFDLMCGKFDFLMWLQLLQLLDLRRNFIKMIGLTFKQAILETCLKIVGIESRQKMLDIAI